MRGRRIPSIQERITKLQAKAAAMKKKAELRETIVQARRELQNLRSKK